MIEEFARWLGDATQFLRELAADNTAGFWAAHRHRHAESSRGPMLAMAAALEAEFGPVGVFRAHVNRRFRPDAAALVSSRALSVRHAGGAGEIIGRTVRAVSSQGHVIVEERS